MKLESETASGGQEPAARPSANIRARNDAISALNVEMYRWGGRIYRRHHADGRHWRVDWRGMNLLNADRRQHPDRWQWHWSEAMAVARRLIRIAESWEGWE